MTRKLLNREQILKTTHGFQTQEVEAFNGVVLVRQLTAAEFNEVTVSMVNTGEITLETAQEQLAEIKLDPVSLTSMFPQIVAWTVVDEDMESILSLEDVQAMVGTWMSDLQVVAATALELSGLEDDGEGTDAKNA